jgi:hypothetical protein
MSRGMNQPATAQQPALALAASMGEGEEQDEEERLAEAAAAVPRSEVLKRLLSDVKDAEKWADRFAEATLLLAGDGGGRAGGAGRGGPSLPLTLQAWWKHYCLLKDAIVALHRGEIRHEYDRIKARRTPPPALHEHKLGTSIPRTGESMDNFRSFLRKEPRLTGTFDSLSTRISALDDILKSAREDLLSTYGRRGLHISEYTSEFQILKFGGTRTDVNCRGYPSECSCGGSPGDPYVEMVKAAAAEKSRAPGAVHKEGSSASAMNDEVETSLKDIYAQYGRSLPDLQASNQALLDEQLDVNATWNSLPEVTRNSGEHFPAASSQAGSPPGKERPRISANPATRSVQFASGPPLFCHSSNESVPATVATVAVAAEIPLSFGELAALKCAPGSHRFLNRAGIQAGESLLDEMKYAFRSYLSKRMGKATADGIGPCITLRLEDGGLRSSLDLSDFPCRLDSARLDMILGAADDAGVPPLSALTLGTGSKFASGILARVASMLRSILRLNLSNSGISLADLADLVALDDEQETSRWPLQELSLANNPLFGVDSSAWDAAKGCNPLQRLVQRCPDLCVLDLSGVLWPALIPSQSSSSKCNGEQLVGAISSVPPLNILRLCCCELSLQLWRKLFRHFSTRPPVTLDISYCRAGFMGDILEDDDDLSSALLHSATQGLANIKAEGAAPVLARATCAAAACPHLRSLSISGLSWRDIEVILSAQQRSNCLRSLMLEGDKSLDAEGGKPNSSSETLRLFASSPPSSLHALGLMRCGLSAGELCELLRASTENLSALETLDLSGNNKVDHAEETGEIRSISTAVKAWSRHGGPSLRVILSAKLRQGLETPCHSLLNIEFL